MATSLRTQKLLVLAAAATLTLTTASVASATEDDPPPPEAGEEFVWPPEDTNGEWLPAPDEAFGPVTLEGCGSSVTMTPGDVDETEYQAMEQADGTIRVEFRGASTADLTREHDGAMIDELDTSGPGHEIYSPDGLTVTFSWEGPSFFYAWDEVEAAVLAQQGLPPVFYYEEGNLTERVVFDADSEAETISSAEVLTDTMRGVYDVCDLLDHAGH